MNLNIRTARRAVCAVLLAVSSIAAVSGCHSGPMSTLTQANLDKVQQDMSAAEVKSILGEPTSSDMSPIPIVGGTKTTYTYSNDTSHIVIVLKNDKVQTKEGTFAPQ